VKALKVVGHLKYNWNPISKTKKHHAWLGVG